MTKVKKLFQKVFVLLLTAVMTVFALYGCSKTEEKVTVSLNTTAIELEVGEKQKLQATVSDGSSVAWSSADESVATVSDKGLVLAVAVGQTTVKAKAGGKSASCTVTVKEKTEEQTEPKRTAFSGGFSVDRMFIGDSLKLNATLTVNGVNETANVTVAYASSDAEVAKIENGLLSALKEGKTTLTATCAWNGVEYSDSAELSVKAFSGAEVALVDGLGNVVDGELSLKNETPLSEQLSVRVYDFGSIENYALRYLSNDGLAKFELTGAEKLGEISLKLFDGTTSLLDGEGNVSAVLEGGITKLSQMNVVGVTIDGKAFETDWNFKTYVKEKITYTDFVEFDQTTSFNDWFSYDGVSAGASLELSLDVTYNGAPSLKLNVPTNWSYFRFTDILSNYAEYGLKEGSKISFMIRYDGEPKTAGTHYYTIGKLTSKNGKSASSNSDIVSYGGAQEYITNGKTEWQEVSYVLTEESFPLVDLGFQIAGNSTSINRYVYIASIKIDNPLNVDYTVNFAPYVGWASTGRNLNSDWWGYANGSSAAEHVSQNATVSSLPSELLASYQSKFGVEAQAKTLLCVPKLENLSYENNRFLQNISCEVTNAMRSAILQGNTKVRARVYMEVEGALPEKSTVNALLFFRKDTNAYNFSADKLQALSPNTWTELTFDVPSEYMNANYFTVAFQLKNYFGSTATMKLHIESLSVGK